MRLHRGSPHTLDCQGSGVGGSKDEVVAAQMRTGEGGGSGGVGGGQGAACMGAMQVNGAGVGGERGGKQSLPASVDQDRID